MKISQINKHHKFLRNKALDRKKDLKLSGIFGLIKVLSYLTIKHLSK